MSTVRPSLPPISFLFAQLGGRSARSPLSPRSRPLDIPQEHSLEPNDTRHDIHISRLPFDNTGGGSSNGVFPFCGPTDMSRRAGLKESLDERGQTTSNHSDRHHHRADGHSSSIAHGSSYPSKRHTSSPPPQQSNSSTSPPREAETQIVRRGALQVLFTQASGLTVAFSAESMKRLRYCLQWLLWAIGHIDSHITFLRDFTVSLQQQYLDPVQEDGMSPTTPTQNRPRKNGHSRTPSTSSISEEHQRKLQEVRKDIVHTVRQVVSVVSKYAGEAGLPHAARDHVKKLILMLPRKWAEAVKVNGVTAAGSSGGVSPLTGDRESVHSAASGRAGGSRRHRPNRERGIGSTTVSPVSSRAPSPSSSPRIPLRGNPYETGSGGHVDGHRTMSASSAMATTQKVLALATESLDMMKNVTGVVKDSLDAADAWVATLRLPRSSEDTSMDTDQLPPPSKQPYSPPSSLDDYRSFQDYRDRETLSPLHSRRSSIDGLTLPPLSVPDSPYSTHSTLAGTGSVPGTPGLSGYHVPFSKPIDAPSPDFRGSLRRMSLLDGDLPLKKEGRDEFDLMNGARMDVDADR